MKVESGKMNYVIHFIILKIIQIIKLLFFVNVIKYNLLVSGKDFLKYYHRIKQIWYFHTMELKNTKILNFIKVLWYMYTLYS